MIIKCPECGHQVSDRAPVCPSCGVEIAGHIVKCGNCGEIHLVSDITCPNCHHSLTEVEAEKPRTEEKAHTEEKRRTEEKPCTEKEVEIAEVPEETAVDEPLYAAGQADDEVQEAVPVEDDEQGEQQDGQAKPKRNFGALVVAFLIAAIVCAVMLYMYRDAQQNNETRMYNSAMQSSEPTVLQEYINTYQRDYPTHAATVQQRLNQLAQQKTTQVKTEEEQAKKQADEADWTAAVKENTEDAFARYKVQHPDGAHNEEADEALRQFARSTIVTPEDENKATAAVRTMLRAINGNNAAGLTAALSPTLTYNGQADSPASAVVDYMKHLYTNVSKLNWYLTSDKAKVTKQEGKLTIVVPARLSQNLNSGSNAQNHFTITATLGEDGRMTALTFNKLAAQPETTDAAQPQRQTP